MNNHWTYETVRIALQSKSIRETIIEEVEPGKVAVVFRTAAGEHQLYTVKNPKIRTWKNRERALSELEKLGIDVRRIVVYS